MNTGWQTIPLVSPGFNMATTEEEARVLIEISSTNMTQQEDLRLNSVGLWRSSWPSMPEGDSLPPGLCRLVELTESWWKTEELSASVAVPHMKPPEDSSGRLWSETPKLLEENCSVTILHAFSSRVLMYVVYASILISTCFWT
jgi:hypothetical protein